MIYFILDNNQKIELTHLKVVFTENNPWFETDFSSELSFPFEMRKADFVKISDFANYNSANAKTLFFGKLYRDGEILEAKLKVHEQKGDVISVIVYAGMEAFPNFDKELKDLPLEKFDVPDLKAHAEEIIRKDYPEVNYQFPMVHTDKYDPESSEFNDFGKIYNNYFGDQFLENIVQAESNTDLIKNIMQPMPYLMHVVQAGITDAGYTLAGDVLEIDDFKRALIFRDGNYFNSTVAEKIPFRVKNNEWLESRGNLGTRYEHVYFRNELEVLRKGDYILFGTIFNVIMRDFLNWRSDVIVYLGLLRDGVLTDLFFRERYHSGSIPGSIPQMWNFDIDIPLSLEIGDKIVFTKTEIRRDVFPFYGRDYPEACSLDLIPVRFRNPDGSPIVSLLDLKEIDLTRVVPDMKFGELISIIKSSKNLDLTIVGNIIYMNFIIPQLDRSKAIDLSDFDIEEPLRTFHDERSYELSFADGKKDPLYPYDSVFVQKDSVTFENYRINKNTVEMKLDFLPYPIVLRNGISTAFAFDDESTKLRLVFYSSAIEGPPLTFKNENMTIRSIYDSHYYDWLFFLVNSIGWTWDFLISVERFKALKIQSLFYAYQNFHVFTEIEKERISRLTWRISAKSESLV